MRILLIYTWLLLLIPATLIAQNPYDTYYCGLKPEDGHHTVYHKNGKIQATFRVEKGHLHDTLTEYEDDGILHCVSVYNEGRLHGVTIQYNKTGTVHNWFEFKNDTLLAARFYDYYKNDTLHWMTYSRLLRFTVFPYEELTTGFLRINLDVPSYLRKLGCRDSVIEFYPNGKLKSIIHYEATVPHGLYQKFDIEGRKIYEATYVKDKLHGDEIYYDENGTETKRVRWNRGKKIK